MNYLSNRPSRIRNSWKELASIAAVVMELSWSVLWYRMFLIHGLDLSYLQTFAILGIMMMGVYGIMRLTMLYQLGLLLRKGLLGLILLVNILAGLEALLYVHETVSIGELLQRPRQAFSDMSLLIPAEFILMLVVIFIGWRGVVFSSQHIGSEIMLSRFRTGIILIFLYGLLFPLASENPTPAIYIFIFSSLIGLSSSRFAILNQIRGGYGVHLDRGWLTGLLSVTLGMVLLAALAVSLTRNRLFDLVNTTIALIFIAIVRLLSPIVYILTRLVFWIGETLNLGLFLNEMRILMDNVQQMLESIAAAVRDWLGVGSETIVQEFFVRLQLFKPWILLSTLILVTMFVLLGVRNYFSRDRDNSELERVSVLERNTLLDRLQKMLKHRIEQMAEQLEEFFGLREMRRMLAAARVRRIYANLMKLCAQLGMPRPVARTPLEFLPGLVKLLPEQEAGLHLITHAYIDVRYGELPESPAEADEVQEAWKHIKDVGQKRLRERSQALKRKGKSERNFQ